MVHLRCTAKTPLVNSVADAIVAFLAAHPQAADTVEGIHQFWISYPGEVSLSVAVTLEALEQLEADGQLERVTLGQRTVWRRKLRP